DAYVTGDNTLELEAGSMIEGIGRPRVERSFTPSIIDRMIKVPDITSLGALRYLEKSLGRRCGGSTGTNFIAALQLAREMHEAGQEGSIVMVLCDGGERYLQTYYSDTWLAERNIDIEPAVAAITACATHGTAMPWELLEHCRA